MKNITVKIIFLFLKISFIYYYPFLTYFQIAVPILAIATIWSGSHSLSGCVPANVPSSLYGLAINHFPLAVFFLTTSICPPDVKGYGPLPPNHIKWP